MKNNKAIFIILILLPSLTGCWGMTLKSDIPKEYNKTNNVIESMYGSTQEEIIEEFGEPEEIVKRGGPTVFIYQWRRNDVDIVGSFFLFLPVPFGVSREDTHLYCHFLGFDEANHLISHASESRVFRTSVDIDCIDIFYPSLLLKPEEVQNAGERTLVTTQRQLQDQANEGNADAQLQLCTSVPDHKDALKWLCRAADRGNAEAQCRLAVLYETGGNGVTKDLVKSYMWYRLSESTGGYMSPADHCVTVGCSYQGQRVRNNMTDEQATRAEALLRNWKPGQCERELVPINTAD